MSVEAGQLLLRHNTTVTCLKGAHEFSLEQGRAVPTSLGKMARSGK